MTAGRGIGRIGSAAGQGNLEPSPSEVVRARVMPSFSRGVLVGLILPFAVGMPLAGFGLQYVPDSVAFGTFARMLESAAPQILVAALLPVAALALVGARRLAAGCLALCVLSGAALAVQQSVVSAPMAPAAPTDLRLLWFNADFRNHTPPERILDEIRDSGADLVMLAEGTQASDRIWMRWPMSIPIARAASRPARFWSCRATRWRTFRSSPPASLGTNGWRSSI